MRKILFACFVSSLVVLQSCERETNTCTTRYYYNGAEKLYQTEQPSKGTISFYEKLTQERIQGIVKKYSEISIVSVDTTLSTYAIVDIDSKSCVETREIFMDIKQHDEVSNCNMWLQTENGSSRGVYDVFFCKLKHDSLENRLFDLVEETQTIYLSKDEFQSHYIKADKHSNGDAIDMANYFYESGYFQWVVPNYLIAVHFAK